MGRAARSAGACCSSPSAGHPAMSTDTHFLLLEIGSLPQRFAALTEQLTGQSCEPHTRQPTPPSAILFQVEISV